MNPSLPPSLLRRGTATWLALILAFNLAPFSQAEEAAKEKNKGGGGDWGAIFKIHWQNRTRSYKEQSLTWQNVVLQVL